MSGQYKKVEASDLLSPGLSVVKLKDCTYTLSAFSLLVGGHVVVTVTCYNSENDWQWQRKVNVKGFRLTVETIVEQVQNQ